MTDNPVNPRRTMAVVFGLALAAAISISEGLKAAPEMLAGDAVGAVVVGLSAVAAFFCVSLIAFVVYAMDRVSERIVHPIRMFDRILEDVRER